MTNVVKLPTAATSHIAVRKAGRFWLVDLVTPISGMKPIRTTLARSENEDVAISFAEEAAAKQQRPLRLPAGRA